MSDPLRVGATRAAIARDVAISAEQLKKHAAFLGSSGSGKTSVALHLMEQLAERGVPSLLIDRKGDLAGYASDAFWTADESDPARAARKAALHERLDVRVFTPGHPEGCALWIPIVPSGLAQLPAHERSHAARYSADAIGAMLGYRDTGGDRAKIGILTKAIEIVAQLAPERADAGIDTLIALVHARDPVLLDAVGHLDEKHFKKLDDELATLRITQGELFKPYGERLRADALFGLDAPNGKVRWSIVSTKFLGDASAIELWISRMLVELGRWASTHPSPTLQAVALFDEADLYMPATSKPATKEPMQDLLKRARSAGLGLFLATQSPGDLDYKSRDNIGTWLVGRVGSPTAIAKMKPLLSECRTNVASQLATAGVGEFFLIKDGEVAPVRTERSLMSTQQLAEHEILALARAHA